MGYVALAADNYDYKQHGKDWNTGDCASGSNPIVF